MRRVSFVPFASHFEGSMKHCVIEPIVLDQFAETQVKQLWILFGTPDPNWDHIIRLTYLSQHVLVITRTWNDVWPFWTIAKFQIKNKVEQTKIFFIFFPIFLLANCVLKKMFWLPLFILLKVKVQVFSIFQDRTKNVFINENEVTQYVILVGLIVCKNDYLLLKEVDKYAKNE